MTTQSIDSAFADLLTRRAVGKTLGISANYVAQLRHKLRTGIPVSLEKKMELLQKSGWRQGDQQYTQKDMVAAVNYALKSSKAAREMGAEYLVEKFLAGQK